MTDLLRILFFISKLYSVLSYGNKPLDNDFYTKCVNSIYRECNHRHEFSEQEIENTRIYIQNRFYNIPNREWRPVRPACKKLRVRKDFKCLTHNEKLELIDALQVLYRSGAVAQLALWPHAVYWGQTNKFRDLFVSHRIILNEYEKALRQVNPRLTLPYWSSYEDFDRPELSILWDYLGGAGDRESQYCVTDGLLANVWPCVKRHWLNDTSIRSWNPIEFIDAGLQNMNSMSDWMPWSTNAHFKVHLSIGGKEGHMSAPNAPYDFSFPPFHVWDTDVYFFKWQLQDDHKLIPESYDGSLIYDWELNAIRVTNLTRDRIMYYNVSVLEGFQLTFGELCSIPDVIVEDVNNVLNGGTVDMPAHYKRMPREMLRKYYPKFYSGNYTPFDFQSYSIRDGCNNRCAPIRQAQDFVDTSEGRTFLERMSYWGHLNIAERIVNLEYFHKEFVDEMNSFGYCSPYVIS